MNVLGFSIYNNIANRNAEISENSCVYIIRASEPFHVSCCTLFSCEKMIAHNVTEFCAEKLRPLRIAIVGPEINRHSCCCGTRWVSKCAKEECWQAWKLSYQTSISNWKAVKVNSKSYPWTARNIATDCRNGMDYCTIIWRLKQNFQVIPHKNYFVGRWKKNTRNDVLRAHWKWKMRKKCPERQQTQSK